MTISLTVRQLLAMGLLAVPYSLAQTNPDPYNPQTRRMAATGNNANAPSLEDLGFGSDQGNMGPFVTMTDKQYAKAMALRGMMEIRLGQAALDKTSRDDVKAVARKLVDDYLKWEDGMSKAAAKLGIPLPTDIDGKEKAEVDRICGFNGSEFDRAYLKEVVQLQQRALTMSHHEADNAAVSGFRHWAGVVVPEIQGQVAMAQAALNKTEAK